MNHLKNSQVEAPDGAPPPCPFQPAIRRRPVIGALIAALVILTPGMIPGSEGQTLLLPEPAGQTAPGQSASLASLVAQGRRHPAYQVFAGQLGLPAITVLDATTLEIGDAMTVDIYRLDQLTAPQQKALAGLFDIPVGVVGKLLAAAASPTPADPAVVALKLRLTVTDYRYMLARWNQYLPPIGKERFKADALLALQTGETGQAWQMYDQLPRPQPPGGIRIAGPN
jgi:hypothetical protein